MPKYEVTDSVTGKRYELEGDSPPTEQELTQIFGQQKQSQPAQTQSASFIDSAVEWGKDKINKAVDVVSGLPEFVSKEGQKLIDSGGKVSNKDIADYQSAVMSFAPLGMSKVAEKPVGNAVKELGDKFGIETTLGEKTKSPITQWSETMLEKLPGMFGIRGFRERQAQQATQAAKDLLKQHIADPTATDVMASNRQYVSGLYDEMKGMIPGIEGQSINPERTKYSAQVLLNRFPDLFKKFQDTKMEKILRNISSELKDTKPGQDILMNTDLGKKATFDDMWALREGLGDMIGQAKKKMSSGDMNKSQLSQLSSLYKSVYNDIDNWASSINKPEISNAIKTANEGYKNFVVKYDVLQKAYDKAAGAEGTGKMFSPQKFSNELNKIILKDKSYGTFTKDEISNMAGMANIMQVVRRAGQYMENPPTGNRVSLPIMGEIAKEAGLLASIPATLTAKFLTTNDKGQKLAMAASRLDPNSKKMAKIIRALAAKGWQLQDNDEIEQ